MKGHIDEGGHSPPTIAIILVKCIENPLIAIEDQRALTPIVHCL